MVSQFDCLGGINQAAYMKLTVDDSGLLGLLFRQDDLNGV